MPDLLTKHIEYAIRLATDKGELEYEEFHKLLSLRDEIECLREIGLVCTEENWAILDSALKQRFHREMVKAHLVAEDRVEDWKKGWWWYRETLTKKANHRVED